MTETTSTTRTTTTTPTYHCHSNPSSDAGHAAGSVHLCLGVQGMDFLQVTSSAVTESRVKRIIKQEVAEVANVTASEIEVELFAGSVVAEITVMPNHTLHPGRDR